MSTRWSPFAKQVVVISSLIGLIWLLARVQLILPPLILALVLAYVLSFPVNWLLRQSGWTRLGAVVVTYLALIVVIITAPVLVVPRLVSLLGAFATTLGKVLVELTRATPQPIQITPSLTLDPGVFYEPINQWLRALLGPTSSPTLNLQTLLFPFATGAAQVVRGAVSTVVWLIFILFVSFYIVKDAPKIQRFVLARLPNALRPELRHLGADLAATWDAFIRGQFKLGILMGVIVWVVTGILGLGNAAALGLVSGLLEFVPGVGPVLAAIPAVLIALILGSSWLPLPPLWFAILVALVYFLLQQLENLYLLPRVVGSRMDLHPVVVIVGALAGAQLAGILGILLAAPTIASLRILTGYVVHKLLDEDPYPPVPPPPEPAVLWQSHIQERAICAILFDLDGTIVETDNRLIQRIVEIMAPVQRMLPEANLTAVARRIFLAGNWVANVLITTLELLRLQRWLLRIDDQLRKLRGIRDPKTFEPVPGSLEMLQWLNKRFVLGLVTSRPRKEVADFLARYEINGLFKTVVTREDVSRLEPHPMSVLLAAKQLEVSPRQCVMVGDTPLDVRAAKAAEMLSVGVLSGFGQENDLCDADLVIPSTAQLGGWL